MAMITEEQIWNYIDGNLSDAQAKEFENMLAADVTANALFNEIKKINSELNGQTPASPTTAFVNNVMAALPVNYAASPKFPFKLLLLAILPVIIVTVLLAVVLMHGQTPVTFHNPIKLPALNLSKYYSLFLMADIVLALLFIDELPAIKQALLGKRQ